MSPSNPENDPVQKGLHALGRQIDADEPPAPAAPPAGPAEPAAEVSASSEAPEAAANPVEEGLQELGRQIDEAHRSARGKKGNGDDARRGPAHAAPKKRRSRRRTLAWVTGTLLLVIV